jgi:mRNA interferase RelE/StbE
VYRVDLSRRAEKDLERPPLRGAARVIAVLRGPAEDPRPPGAAKLVAVEGYRVRAGEYRMVYDVDDTGEVVTVYRIRHRREAYRRE